MASLGAGRSFSLFFSGDEPIRLKAASISVANCFVIACLLGLSSPRGAFLRSFGFFESFVGYGRALACSFAAAAATAPPGEGTAELVAPDLAALFGVFEPVFEVFCDLPGVVGYGKSFCGALLTCLSNSAFFCDTAPVVGFDLVGGFGCGLLDGCGNRTPGLLVSELRLPVFRGLRFVEVDFLTGA
jgi:hypothetical protein